MSTTPDNSSGIRLPRKVGDEDYQSDDVKKVTPSRPAPKGFKQLMGEDKDPALEAKKTKKRKESGLVKETPPANESTPSTPPEKTLTKRTIPNAERGFSNTKLDAERGFPNTKLEKNVKTPSPVLSRKDSRSDDDDDDVTELIALLSQKSVKPKSEIKSKESDEVQSSGDDEYYDAVVKKSTPNAPKKDVAFSDENTPADEPWRALLNNKIPHKNGLSKDAPREVLSKESPFNLYSKQLSKDDNKLKTEKKDKFTSRYQEEQPDLSSVNPFQANSWVAAVGESKEQISPHVSANIKEIVDQIVKQLYTIERAGQTDTVIIVKHPPLFEDAQIVLTSFDSATKEFNLTFENLSAHAKQVLDDNMPTLKTTLEMQGYANAVHIITTTTLVEHHFPGHDQTRDDQYAGGDQGGSGQQSEEEEDLT